MCMADFGDPPTIYRTKIQRARKIHQCEECGREIRTGERYQSAFLVYEGGSESFCTCEHCITGQKWLSENCGGYLHGGIWEDLEEHITEYPTLAFPLLRLKVGRRRRWERFDGAGLMAVPAVPPSLEVKGLGRE